MELVDATSGLSEWNLEYNELFDNIFEIQIKIAKNVMHGFSFEDSGQSNYSTSSPEAYGQFLKGNEYYSQGFDSAKLEKAINHFSKAIVPDSSYMEA